jgi:hypothetical protein
MSEYWRWLRRAWDRYQRRARPVTRLEILRALLHP